MSDWGSGFCDPDGPSVTVQLILIVVAAKKAEKNKDWKPMVYVVIAVTLTAIGGMGIGCVMIFVRNRF